MASLNRVILAGNLTRDPEVRHTTGGAAVATLGLAVNRYYMTKTGERKEETLFISVVVWGKAAERCKEYLKKGSSVLVEGRLASRSWEQNGQKRSTVEVVALNVQFLDRAGKGAPERGAPDMDEVPDDVLADDADKKDVGGEDDIPF
ncbi:MAG TPA: single-stranded DNA-binding protein [bacterium]|nr:single-stranded DNA-binding protein [bacterium]